MDTIAAGLLETEQENIAYTGELTRLAEQIAALTAEDQQRRRAFAAAEVCFYDAESRKKGLRERADALQRNEADLRAEIERHAARLDFLRGLIESREGLPEGVRFLVSSDRWSPSLKLTVADAVHAEEDYRVAIEAALGDMAGLMIVASAGDAARGVTLLQEEEKGKAAFVCLDRLPRIVRNYAPPALPGVRGWALDLARFDPEYASLFAFLLDRILIVDDSAAAAAVAAVTTGVRCVTLQGEIGTSVGILRGGSRRHDEGGNIGKQQQMESIRETIAGIEARLSGVSGERSTVLAKHDAIDLKELNEEVKTVEKEMHAVEMRIAQVAFEKKRAEETIEENSAHIARLTAEIDNLREDMAARLPELERLRAEKDDIDMQLRTATDDVHLLEEEWNERTRVVQELGIALVHVRNDHQTSVNDLERAGASIGAIGENLEKHRVDADLERSAISSTETGVEANRRELERLFQELHLLEARRTDVEQETATQRNAILAAELRIRDQRRVHDDALRFLHDTELKIADLTARADHLRARAREEFELDLELKTYPDTEFVDFAALREEIQALKDKIKTMGNINFAAFEEYTAEKQRLEFMTAQRADLLEAERTLLATIEEINATAQRKFLETFALIRTNFIDTFKSLFDLGDEADLKLEEEVDPLEARIEIVAKPRGKRPTSIDLLSGGEKTLTATALLFAIYLVKPSPFCILDEVDAPLDDSNVDRFTRILRKFSNNTQFIVVTHNKRTMEAANALYGVTMEEEGVSKLVTVRFNQGTQIAAAAVASA